MAASTTVTLSLANVARLGRLIVACNDGARAQTAAALVVRGSRGVRLNGTAARRGSFADELAAMIQSFGGTPTNGASAFETIRAALHAVNALVIGENVGDAYVSCARIEAKTARLYERAIDADMQEPVSELIARHYVEIAADGAEFRRLSMGG